MKSRYTAVSLVALACILLGVTAVWSQTRTGDWTIRRSDVAGQVRFSLIESRLGRHSEFSSDWPLRDLQGLDTSKAGRHEVHFTVSRDAGKFDCEGFFDNGEGAGLFHFFPRAQYAEEMKSLGFDVDEEKQLAMAAQDVSLEFAKQMKGEHLEGLNTDKLIAFRIFGVTPEFIERLKALGYAHPEPDQLIAMQIHGVTPEYISKMRSQHGLPNLTIEELISLRIHGID